MTDMDKEHLIKTLENNILESLERSLKQELLEAMLVKKEEDFSDVQKTMTSAMFNLRKKTIRIMVRKFMDEIRDNYTQGEIMEEFSTLEKALKHFTNFMDME